MKWLCRSILLFGLMMMSIHPLRGNTAPSETKTREIHIASWLINGPFDDRLPAFSGNKNVRGKTYGLADLIKHRHAPVEKLWPADGDVEVWTSAERMTWRTVMCDTAGVLLETDRGDSPQIAYLAAYVDARRYTKAKVEISGFHLLRIFLDGKPILDKGTAEKPKDGDAAIKAGKVSMDVDLETGKHLILVKTLRDPECRADWVVRGVLRVPSDYAADDLRIVVSPRQTMTISHMLDGPKVRGVSVSPDGELAAVQMRQSMPPSDRSESWIELRRIKDGSLVQTYRGGMSLSSVNWAPVGRRFSYTSSGSSGRTLWIVDMELGTNDPLLEDVKNLGGHTWAHDGSFIVYSVTEEPEDDATGMKRLHGMTDRWPGWRDRNFLYRIDIPGGTSRRLTSGLLSTDLQSISPDGKKLLFARSHEDFSRRPYSYSEFMLMDMEIHALDTLIVSYWIQGMEWSPDGKKLLVTGGPMTFDGIGKNVPAGMIPNDYDTQAFIYSPETGEVDPITKNFDPSIGFAVWSKTEEAIYIAAGDRSYRRLFRYDIKRREFEALETGVDVLGGFDISENGRMAVYTGSGVSQPPKAYVMDLRKKRARLLFDPGVGVYQDVMFGTSERWTFTNTRGVEIDGRIYYPPGFDSTRKYPCIVYYYGGTSPVTRDFGGRYPKEIWAANGYVVYVLQPSGATGFGQAFSALHVNDWGKIVADEIIEGTREFLVSHEFVDPDRVGCIGASYGGFMTMLLTTRTDIFSAAVAHAGISSISSYWGEGFWGYLYSATATANSFPWNRRDIYLDQSPLFYADKVTTPILLLHGNADTNVPPGESRQFYAALKLLGREAELIEVEDQDHHILQYNKRIRWTKTIIAWFDRWLKDQAEWWDHLYPGMDE